MKNTLIALTTAVALGTGALAISPAAAAPLAPAQLAFAIDQTANGIQLAKHHGKKHWGKKHWGKKHSKWHHKKHWGHKPGYFYVSPGHFYVGLYPHCYAAPGGYYCTY
jgi:hypothetical protein